MATAASRRIAAHYILYRGELVRNGIISLASDGTVTDASFSDRMDAEAGVEFYNGILVPGLVNAHCHLELSYLRGAIPEGTGFTGFARAIGEKRGGSTPEQRDAAIKDAGNTLLRQGVSLVGDVCNGTTTFPLKEHSEVRYYNFLELFGLGSSPGDLEPAAACAAAHGLEYSLTPHSTYSLNDAAFSGAVTGFDGQTGGRHAPLSIHFMESDAEQGLYSGTGEMARWYGERGLRTDFSQYGSPAARLTALVPPEKDVLLVHNCFVTEEIVERVAAHFSGRVTWVLCPRSNHYISRISPPYGMLRRKGVKIAVGTDSLASNRSLDMLAEMRSFPDVPLAELLIWATKNGAEGLGKDDAGSFEPGRRPGGTLITGIDWDNMSLTPDSRSERLF